MKYQPMTPITQRKKAIKAMIALGFISTLVACGESTKSANSTNATETIVVSPTPTPIESQTPTPTPTSTEFAISPVPTELAATFSAAMKFDRYTFVAAPNGGKIHILAQDQIKTGQMVRARSILQHYLTDLPGSQFGNDKSAIANKMAENGATLLLLNGVDDGTNPAAELNGQPLYYGEMQVEGGEWYIKQNYEHRDASYEEILHLVHDYGIGVDQNAEFIGAAPEFQSAIRAAQVAAVSQQLWAWTTEFKSWVTELSAENSLSQEYLASVIDSYYGLWGAHSGEHGMWGAYIAKTRQAIEEKDALASGLMAGAFFHPHLTYNAQIDSVFNGEFSLKLDPAKPYTHHAQYLKDITFQGNNDTSVVINQLDNHITGNTGLNTAIFSGNSSEYQIEKTPQGIKVSDMQDNRDGVNRLIAFERLKFTDSVVEISSL